MFSQISWWRLRELYIFSGPEKELIRFAREKMDIYPFDKDGVIAVGFNSNAPNLFNYYFNRDFIYFAPATIEKISGKKELNSVFERYRIAGFIGYGKETTKIINENTGYKLKNYIIRSLCVSVLANTLIFPKTTAIPIKMNMLKNISGNIFKFFYSN